MTQERQQQLLEAIANTMKKAIKETDKQWNEGVSHAQIVGYLQGTMKGIIAFCEDDIKKKDEILG